MALRPAARDLGDDRPCATSARGSGTSTTTCELHAMADRSLGVVLKALEDSGTWDDTVVIFTSDHGDMCGSHGLRSKGPFVYEEIMRVPLYIRVPGVTRPGTTTEALATHVDLAATICGLAGVGSRSRRGIGTARAGLQGVDLGPVLADPTASVQGPRPVRPGLGADRAAESGALRASRILRRETKYARYYGDRRRKTLHRTCGARTRARSSSMWTATSTIRTTSGTTIRHGPSRAREPRARPRAPGRAETTIRAAARLRTRRARRHPASRAGIIGVTADRTDCRRRVRCAPIHNNPITRSPRPHFQSHSRNYASSVVAQAAEAFAPPRRSSGRLVVVDDDPEIRGLLVRLLEAEGYQVRDASTGQEALASSQPGRPT